MVYFAIDEKKPEAKKFYEFLKTLDYIEIIEEKEFKNKISKEEFLNDFRQSLKEVKNKKTKPLKHLLNDK